MEMKHIFETLAEKRTFLTDYILYFCVPPSLSIILFYVFIAIP